MNKFLGVFSNPHIHFTKSWANRKLSRKTHFQKDKDQLSKKLQINLNLLRMVFKCGFASLIIPETPFVIESKGLFTMIAGLD